MLRNIIKNGGMKYRGLCYGPKADKQAVIDVCREDLWKWSEYLSDKTWLAGDDITWVDLVMLENLEYLDALGDIVKEFPNL